MKLFKIVLLTLSLHSFFCIQSKAQSLELIGGNIVNGAMTGAILGTAVMGLQDSNDFTPFRIGLGSGILAGSGLAIYDVATLPRGQQFFKSGVFNDGNNSSIIVLLDTIYGAGLGAALGSAIVLIGNESFVEGIQYGASAGAWAGFGFGIVDSFILSQNNRDLVAGRMVLNSGLLDVNTKSTEIEFFKPAIFELKRVVDGNLQQSVNPALTVFSMKHHF